MNPNRSHWNEQQQALRQALSHGDAERAIPLFLGQHASVHSAALAQADGWSFEDEVWQGLAEDTARRIPDNGEHSLAWIFWHIARIEDVTMNLLIAPRTPMGVAGSPQRLHQDGWLEKLRWPEIDTGNGDDVEAVARLSAAIDLAALRAYRSAVGRRTREIVCALGPADLKRKIDPARLERILAEGAVRPQALGLLDYWGGLTIAGLLLMPPTRHNFLHLNECLRIRQKLER